MGLIPPAELFCFREAFMTIVYLCNPLSNTECPKSYCKKLNNGECQHTTKKQFRLNDKDGALFIQVDGKLVEYECLNDYIKERAESEK